MNYQHVTHPAADLAADLARDAPELLDLIADELVDMWKHDREAA